MEDDLPDSERLSRALRLTLEGAERESRLHQDFPDMSESDVMSLCDICDNLLQAAEDFGIAMADRRMRPKDFDLRITQVYPLLTDADVALLLSVALRSGD